MRFLYGDSTRFPLDSNFIETLKAVVEASAALLKVDQQLERGRQSLAAAQGDAERAAVRLDQMAIALVAAMEPQRGSLETPLAEIVGARVVKAAQEVLESSRGDITLRREQAMRDLDAQANECRNGITRAIDNFFANHDLVGTVWRLRWRGGPADEAAHLLARATTAFALDALLEVQLPPTHLFSRAFRLGDLERGVKLRLPTASGWIRKTTDLKPTLLDAYLVTEVICSPEKMSFVLRKPGKPPMPGFEVVVRAEGQPRPLLQPLREKGEEIAEPIFLEVVERTNAQRVMQKLEESLTELSRGRRRLEKAIYEGTIVRDHDRPAQLAARFIATIAPLTREMRRRGATIQELVLKHDLGGGRREEIYVERRELLAMFADLDVKRRAYFDVLALEREDITETAVTAQIVVGELVASEGGEGEEIRVAPGPPPPPKSVKNGSVRRKSEPPKPVPLGVALTQLSNQSN